jgi:hypothetical protein
MLHETFGPDSPVYVWMKATVYNEDDPETGVWTASSGGVSPEDANVPVDPNSTSPEGLFSSTSLRSGVRVRHDDPMTGLASFGFPDLPINQGQRLALQLIVAPLIWFESAHVSPDAIDRAAMSTFIAALGSVGGPVGSVAGAILGALWGGGGVDADVPCYNPILFEMRDWDGNELDGLVRESTHEYGPTGAPPSYGCPRANASYWLSFDRVPEFTSRPPSCLAYWVDGDATDGAFNGHWGDYGITTSDQVNAWITRVPNQQAEVYNVRIRERRSASADIVVESFQAVPVTEERLIFLFYRNVFEFQPFGYRQAIPCSTECSAFTNVSPAPPWVDQLNQLQSLSMLAEAWRERLPPRRLPKPGPPRSGPPGNPAPFDVNQTLPASMARIPHSSASHDSPVISHEPLIPRSGIFRRFLPEDERPHSLYNARVLRLDPTTALTLFGEFRDRKLLQTRIRYLRTDDWGSVHTDVLLRPTYEPPR